jgi:hypothetical protein
VIRNVGHFSHILQSWEESEAGGGAAESCRVGLFISESSQQQVHSLFLGLGLRGLPSFKFNVRRQQVVKKHTFTQNMLSISMVEGLLEQDFFPKVKVWSKA